MTDNDDQSSDALFSVEEYTRHPSGIQQVQVDGVHSDDQVLKIAADDSRPSAVNAADGSVQSPLLDEEARSPSQDVPSVSTDLSVDADAPSENNSVHSAPPASSAASPTERPATPRTADARPQSRAASAVGRPSEAGSERPHRHQSVVESRASNRLSGFFNNLIHRRDPMPQHGSRGNMPAAGQTPKDDSRSTSPRPGPPSTPPPALPPPTLQELGLSLEVLTSDLSPSHFSTPPSSGAFLAPHYLLLCHAQGLDVLPLVSPPAPQPYALVRRVSFKSVVVMEQRNVLVAIAGRRDGVRVYALEDVKKAVEWRIEVEVRREREKLRRDAAKKTPVVHLDDPRRGSTDKPRKSSQSTLAIDVIQSNAMKRMPSAGSLGPRSAPVSSSTRQLIPRTPTTRRSVTPPPPANIPNIPEPRGRPPPYSSPVNTTNPLPTVHSTGSVVSLPRSQHSQRSSVNNVLAAAPPPPRRDSSASGNAPDAKTEWQQDSDEEAINVVAAGASGSQALDERTSSTASRTPTLPQVAQNPPPMFIPAPRSSQGPRRGHRPSSLDLTITHSTPIAPPEPSPVPTLLTLRQALSHLPMPSRSGASSATADRVGDAEVDGDDDDDDGDTGLSLAEILLESRLPDLPPVGTRRQQEPILIGSEEPSSPRTSDGLTPSNRSSNDASPTPTPSRSRRRWSVIIRQGQNPAAAPPGSPTAANSAPVNGEYNSQLSTSRGPNLLRSASFLSNRSLASSSFATPRPRSAGGHLTTASTSAIRTTSPLPPVPANHRPASSHRSRSATRSTTRFIPRIISNAIANMRIDAEIGDRSVYGQASRSTDSETGSTKPRVYGTLPHAPPPKLEYLKLPGTKGALFVKAVETPKKSFLAILCGDNGEKVELFAGTYRTTLGLSRTFILPDSPRLLELQLQGDDLVEVFLVFSQNVFGLEPATVRVREVRIGRAERRAARRRAREIRTGEAAAVESNDNELQGDDDVNVNVSVSVAVQSQQDAPSSSALVGDQHPADRNASETQAAAAGEAPNERIAHAEELVALAAAQLGPYTTFQQLSFAPKFPLASIADEYIIPPTYPDFIKYRNAFENSSNDNTDLTQAQFSPPGLPVPTPTAPSKWYYRDPKDVIHGPWKASLMQAWYKDGLLPPDLPVRREEDAEFMLLKDLRLQCVDPTHPFRSPTVVPHPGPQIDMSDPDKPLLPPISLLAQPAHFGPPALFFSSRGGHSTAIVDARGRSVLKSRFLWSGEEPADDENKLSLGRMGDVKRLEAFDVDDRSILVAMRQGGLEAVDLSDALLKPADVSRTVFPQFEPSPSNINRRGPFVWKIGTPVSKLSNTSLPSPLPTLTPLKSARLGVTHHLKKQGTGSAKSPGGKTDLNASNYDSGEEMQDEVLFLGRRDDELYICERNAGSFRILRLGPSTS